MKTPSHDPSAWSRIAPFLDRALDLDPSDRETWFTELTTTHPDIAQVVREMLVERELLDAKGFLATSLSPNIATLAGARVGAYTIDRMIGRGGMGEVWLATRNDGRFEGRCAIKFLDESIVSAKLADRFRREGHLLARLTHPNIARLIDAGATEEGRPYLALEYVDGERIDRYCESHSLSIEARVRLFVDVVAAVAHAHTHLIIHRDLKPSNVLVTVDGQVKLLDFGIAKLLSADQIASDGLTRIEDAALTPEYAAPEQLLGEMPSTATDVYQLGMLLYVLLTGRHPVQATGTRAEKIRAALDGVLPRASEFADKHARKKLQGDLDAILSMALRKNPSDRYATAQALQEELLRYLNQEPVQARRGAIWYRARKFVGRHRLTVAAAVLLLTSLATGLVVVNEQRLIAERRFNQLRQLSSKVFELDNAIQELQGSTAAREQLVSVSLEYLVGLAADAGKDVDLQFTLADAYWRVARIQGVPIGLNLGDTAKAEQHLAKAAAFADEALATQSNDVETLYLSAMIANDRMIVADTERRAEAMLIHARKSADRLDDLVNLGGLSKGKQREILSPLTNIAIAFMNMGQYEDSSRVSRRLLASARALPESSVMNETSQGLSVLGNALRLQGDLEGALAAIREARHIAEKTVFNNENLRMRVLYGILYREGLILGEDRSVSLNRPQEAAAAFQAALDITEASARRDPQDAGSRRRMATVSSELGGIFRHTDPQKALAVYDTALARIKEMPISDNTRQTQASLLANSVSVLVALGRTSDAKNRLDTAFAHLTETNEWPNDRISFEDPAYAVLYASAQFDAGTGRVGQAVAAYRMLLDKLDFGNLTPQADLRVAFNLDGLYRDLGELYERTSDMDQAASINARRLELWRVWQRRLPGNPLISRQLDQIKLGNARPN